jgi:hypothetical protein
MNSLKSLNLAVAFLLELGMLAAYVYWGFALDTNIFFRIIAGVGVPMVVVILWGIWLAPNADLRLRQGWLLALKTFLFGAASLALFISGARSLGIALLAFFAANQLLSLIWDQERAVVTERDE